jgi:hypothetical protein
VRDNSQSAFQVFQDFGLHYTGQSLDEEVFVLPVREFDLIGRDEMDFRVLLYNGIAGQTLAVWQNLYAYFPVLCRQPTLVGYSSAVN